ncbi:MAG: hypothetical protein NTV55_06915 [Planctomycetota bacterium]|nr:hypothetical protein [Planctomycetota bacterium]
MLMMVAGTLVSLLAQQQALELKVARFTELARAVHAHKGKVLIVDVWHRT